MKREQTLTTKYVCILRFWATKTHCPNCAFEWSDGAKMRDMLFNLSKVDFFWINRDQTAFEWFVQLLSALELEQV